MRLKEKLLTTLLLVPLAGTSVWAKEHGNFDALLASHQARSLPVTEAELQARGARVDHMEERLGLPTILWNAQPGPQRTSTLSGLRPEQAARTHLQKFADLYRLTSEDISSASLQSVHKTDFGPVVARFGQSIDGVEVFRGGINVVMDRSHNLVAITGYLAPHEAVAARQRTASTDFRLSAADAIALAFKDLTDTTLTSRSLVRTGTQAAYTHFSFEPGVAQVMPHAMAAPARAKQVYFTLPDGLQPAYYVELTVGTKSSDTSEAYSFVVSATDGTLLFRNDLTAEDAYTYRVWADATSFIPYDGPQGDDATPHPTGTPDRYQAPFVSANLITLQNAPFSRNDPWLAPGATQTAGNNADAYADLGAPDGYQPEADLRPANTAPGSFDYTYDVTLSPSASPDQRKAAIVHLFYLNNFLHDWYYDAGFDEASGNAQTLNFGRGGLEGDNIKAEAQDYGGRNNANMTTPADGARPRMQMYVFDGVPDLRVQTPASVAGGSEVGTGAFGNLNYDLSGDLQILDPAGNTFACAALPAGTFAGKIAVVDRGPLPPGTACGFTVKALIAQQAGAIGVVIANHTAGQAAPGMAGADPAITVPVLSVTKETADAWKSEVRTNSTTITVRMKRSPNLDRDGTIDNNIVAHEWGHYISNRLIGNSNGLSNNQGRSMGEGWADFHAMLLSVHDSDRARAGNDRFQGVYAMAGYVTSGGVNNGYYYGIRRVPYSTDMAKNALTFKHIGNGSALPTSHPVSSGATGVGNSEVHNAGEVWATMLWECYASLLNAYAFPEAQNRMKQYLVAAYKITPNSPNMLEARDAVLAAAAASDPADYTRFAQAFAKRGAGFGAKAPDRNGVDHVGAVESFAAGNNLEVTSTRLDDSAAGCDSDGALDKGETGMFSVTVRNTGASALAAFMGTVTASGTTATIEFPNGNTLAFPALQPGATTTRTLRVRLSDVTGTEPRAGLTITFDEPSLPTAARTATYDGRVHYDEAMNAAASDGFDGELSAWTYTNSGSLPGWAPATERPATGPLNRYLHVPDFGVVSDTLLTSPWIRVNAAGNFTMTYKYRHSVEGTVSGSGMVTPFYDGVVLEITTDGVTWKDAFSGYGKDPGYTAFLASGGNPLSARAAFAGTNTGFPNWSAGSVDFGTLLAGKNIRFRFRIGTDTEAGAYGFDLDDVALTNITGTPFGGLVAETSDGTTCNRRPVADAGQARSVNERDAAGAFQTVGLNGTASFDPDGQPLTYAWTQLAGPTVVLANPTSAAPTFTADVPADTVFVFQLVASDGIDSSLPKQVAITIVNTNRKPVALPAGPGTVPERSTATIALNGTGSTDADGETLTYAWTQTVGPTVTLTGAATATASFPTPEVTANTSYTFRLVTNDGKVASDPVTVTVMVTNVDRAPTADAGADQTVSSRTSVALKGAGSDPDSDAVTYAWTQESGTAVTLTGADTAAASFTAPDVRTETVLGFKLTSTANGQSTSDTVTVTVQKANRRPVSRGSSSVEEKEGTALTLDASSSTDADGDPLSYHWTQIGGPQAQVTGQDTAMLQFTTPEVSADTTLAFTLVATDSDGEKSDVLPVSVKVLNVNKAPTAKARKLSGSLSKETITLDASLSTDPDGEPLTYKWEQTDGASVGLSSDTEPSVTFTAPTTTANVTLAFQVTVKDSHGASASQEVQVEVTGVKEEGGCASTGSSSGSAMLLALLAGVLLSRRRLTLRA